MFHPIRGPSACHRVGQEEAMSDDLKARIAARLEVGGSLKLADLLDDCLERIEHLEAELRTRTLLLHDDEACVGQVH